LSKGLLQILLDHGGHFVQLNDSIDGCGNTPLMLLVWNISKYEWSPISTSKVALLLERGASPWVSNHHGNTVLHIVLENYSQNPTNAPYSRERYNVLMAVIGAGADVTARNLAGYTVSDYAYMWNRGAEWEDALRASGHDQSEVCGVSNQQPKAERKGSILEKKCTVIFGSRRYRMCQVCQQTDVSIEIVEEEV
jgi:hypothetical protein